MDSYITLCRVLFHAFVDKAFDYRTYVKKKSCLTGSQLPLFREKQRSENSNRSNIIGG